MKFEFLLPTQRNTLTRQVQKKKRLMYMCVLYVSSHARASAYSYIYSYIFSILIHLQHPL